MSTRDQFIADNLRLVHSCCHRFKGRGIEYDDLYQAGCIGLIKATDRFDKSRGLQFSTYAVPVILGEIKRLFRDGGAVKVGRTLKELSMKAMRAKDELALKLGRDVTISELAEHLNISLEDAAQAVTAALPVMSLTVDSDEGRVELDIAAEGIGEEALHDKMALKEVIARLEEKDKQIINLRYFKSKTQTQTAQELGMTQVQVSRRERVILGELRRKLS